MATRGTIAVQHLDGTVSCSYAHWDNYLEHNGKILFSHYTNLNLIEKLVSYGQISSLGIRITPVGAHSFDEPEEGTTVYYGRDRGEPNTEAETFSSIEDYLTNANFQEYNYLWTEYDDQNENRVEGWLVEYHMSGKHSGKFKAGYSFIPLEAALSDIGDSYED